MFAFSTTTILVANILTKNLVKTLQISVTFIGVGDGGEKKKKRSTTLGHEPEHQPLPPLDITRSNNLLKIQPHCI